MDEPHPVPGPSLGRAAQMEPKKSKRFLESKKTAACGNECRKISVDDFREKGRYHALT